MHKNCFTEESASRQKQLEDQLLKNMLLKPYDHVSVSDLCEQCGISRKSFYRYFGNKDGCLSALIDRALMESTEYRFRPNRRDCPPPVEIQSNLTYWKENRTILDVLAQNGLSGIFVERAIAHAVQEEKALLRAIGVEDPQQDQDVLVFFFSGYVSLLMHWRKTGYQKTVAQMTDLLIRLITQPLLQAGEA